MFESDFIDGFSRTPWWVVPLVWLPVSGAFGWVGLTEQGGFSLGLVFATLLGWLAWTFSEYGLHRTLFHWVRANRFGPQIHFILHGVHHQWVKDPYRLVMPPVAALVLAIVLGGSLWGLFALGGAHMWFWSFFSGFVFGYVVYDVSHYALHHLRIRNRLFARLRHHHMQHHHNPRFAERKFGVSTTLWDHIFRTY